MIGVSLSKDVIDILRKLRANHLNISRFVESAIREYLSKSNADSGSKTQSIIDINRYAVVEKDTFFMNVCRNLLAHKPGEWTRLRIDSDFSNAIALAYGICRDHYFPSSKKEQEQELAESESVEEG